MQPHTGWHCRTLTACAQQSRGATRQWTHLGRYLRRTHCQSCDRVCTSLNSMNRPSSTRSVVAAPFARCGSPAAVKSSQERACNTYVQSHLVAPSLVTPSVAAGPGSAGVHRSSRPAGPPWAPAQPLRRETQPIPTRFKAVTRGSCSRAGRAVKIRMSQAPPKHAEAGPALHKQFNTVKIANAEVRAV